MRRALGIGVAVLLLGAAGLPARAADAPGDFVHFESSHVHPLVLGPRGLRLYAVNTPEARLSIFKVRRRGLRFWKDVPVGLEPVSVTLRPGTDQAWVANHLSDSVSVVDVRRGVLIATVQVGDEPTDVAFAAGHAFVSLAGVEDRVAVLDPDRFVEVASIDIFSEEPRALAVSPDGSRVAVVALESGNRTSLVPPFLVRQGGGPPAPFPPRDVASLPPEALPEGPDVGLIVRFDPHAERWEDEAGGDWTEFLPYRVADQDLFWIDAGAQTPVVVEATTGVGTSLFDVAIHPATGEAWVANTDARNFVRFEPNLRGHLLETRISIVGEGGTPRAVDLNPHIDYRVTPGTAEEIARSLAQPGDGAFSRDGTRFYLTAFGSSRVAELDGSTGEVLERIAVPGGPSGLALHERRQRLYVMSRFENAIAIVDTRSRTQIGAVGVAGPGFFDPSPPEVRSGRRLLYDAALSSGHGDASCASCHLFGNFDGLAWDLGDPGGAFAPYDEQPWLVFGPIVTERPGFDPMKGPMTTQTLRGMRGNEPFHWRGDRRDFHAFNPAFDSLLGRGAPLPDALMDQFNAFIMSVALPPNPHRELDDTLPETVTGGDPANGERIFSERAVVAGFTCNGCHQLPLGTGNTIHRVLAGNQDLKIPHLRNVYEKTGFDPLRGPFRRTNFGNDVLRAGFGVAHAGASSLAEFVESFTGLSPSERHDILDTVLSFSTGTPPCVGVQRDLRAEDREGGDVAATVEALIREAEVGRCDLVARTVHRGAARSHLFDPGSGAFLPDTRRARPLTLQQLLASLAPPDLLTLTAVPAGSGLRLGIDRDGDGCLDGDDRSLGGGGPSPRSCRRAPTR